MDLTKRSCVKLQNKDGQVGFLTSSAIVYWLIIEAPSFNSFYVIKLFRINYLFNHFQMLNRYAF